MYRNKIVLSSESPCEHLVEKDPLKFVYNPEAEENCINIYTDLRFQKVEGFGSAITDASSINYSRMSDKIKNEFITSSFDKEEGLGLNFCRVTIGSCDYSADDYAYIDENDDTLKTFDISHDKKNIIPLLKDAYKEAKEEFFVFASPWSPPAFMKDNNCLIQGGKLKKEYLSVYAEYFVKYIKSYRENGINLGGITVQNEPMASQTWESCRWTAEETAVFVRDYLSPALDKAGLSDVKIMVWDHNKEHVYDWAKTIKNIEGASEKIWGIAFHWYSGSHFESLDYAKNIAPEFNFVESEYCCGGKITQWSHAEKYAVDITGNFNHHACATTDWNLVLDEEGGPFHNRKGRCTSMFVYDKTNDKLLKTPLYYAFAHFSKYINKGAVRLGTSRFSESVSACAFLNPDGTIVCVLTNTTDEDYKSLLRVDDYSAKFTFKSHSIMTVIIENK